MHRGLNRRHDRDERGAVAILVAASLTALVVVVAMVLDFGLVRIDRQVDKSAADAATLAGLHGLNTGDGTPHPYAGVCNAIRYLDTNNSRFSGVYGSGDWTDGLGATQGDGCKQPLTNAVCEPGDKSSWARWHWTGTSGGVTLDVTIQSGYDFSTGTWAEDTLPATSGDTGDSDYEGCDQLAVVILQSREPGLGSLATSSDLQTGIRSVGRIEPKPGDSAPAMLLLKQTGCPVVKTGASGGTSYIHVLGALSSNGNSQGGSIHSDSDGTGCNGSNNSWVYGGLGANGIVAYAAPLESDPLAPDPAKPGSITSYAAYKGITGLPLRDSLTNVYSSSALDGTGGTHTEVTGRDRVTRGLVDDRYFVGVKAAMSGAKDIFAAGATGAPPGWTPLAAADKCKPTQSEVTASVATADANTGGRLYINCNDKFVGDNTATPLTIDATSVYFRGWINPAKPLKLPKATHVYIGNHTGVTDALSLGTGAEFQVHTESNLDLATGNCTVGQSLTDTNKAALFVRDGRIKQTGGLLRMCRTTAFMMGGMTNTTPTVGPGCVPVASGTAPTSTPCNGGLGTGQFTQNGGGINWTAPDFLDATTDPATGDPLATAVTGWEDPNGPEDLALWSESGSNSSTNFSMAGGGLFAVRGVYMVPNAEPFIISGGSHLDLTNAQYIASSVELNGNTTSITMKVDPNAAVTLPDQGLVGLVR